MSNKFKQIVNCHQHSDYSLDGAATSEDLAIRTAQLGATHLALTDHGVLNGLMSHYEACKAHGIKPILGCEFYIENPCLDDLMPIMLAEVEADVPADAKDRVSKIEGRLQTKIRNEYVHLTCHFKTEAAYLHFCKLTPVMESRALVKFGERKPILKLEELHAIRNDITICSSCLVGTVQKFLLPRRGSKFTSEKLAEKAYGILREIVGPDSFYVEIFPHEITKTWKAGKKDPKTKQQITKGFFEDHECTMSAPTGDIQFKPNEFVWKLAQKNGDRALISLDSHFATVDQRIVQEARLGNGQEAWKFSNSYHIMSTDEAAVSLQRTLGMTDNDIHQMVDNSYHFASHFDNFKLTTNKDRWIIEAPPENWPQIIQAAINRHGRMNWQNPDMVARLRHEINILANNGTINLIPYFLTVEDIANFCRENHILMNTRGSAGGSLLLYVLGVSSVNPLKHDLSFGRMLTLGRIKANTLPDVDMDISDRDAVISYLEGKYGDRMLRLSTDMRLKLKNSIKDAERAIYGKVNPKTEKFTGTLPAAAQGRDEYDFVFGYTEDGVYVQGLIETSQTLQAYVADNPEVWRSVTQMLGIQRQKGSHSCGVIIADKPVHEYMPVAVVAKEFVTGYSPKSLEKAGGIKYDLLGLNTLRDIQICLDSIEERTGQRLVWNELPQDLRIYQALWDGDTVGVFQFDTETVGPGLPAIRPASLDGLAALTALYRPGTMDATDSSGRTLVQVYTARANGEPVTYVHPDLEPILGETYGVNLYQEQTLSIFRNIGGFTDEEAEDARRGIGKKDKKVLAEATHKLKQACIARGWTEEQADIMFNQIMASANYSFNKSHAVSYAYVAYACQYLKMNFKLDWWKAILTNAKKDEIASKFWPFVSDFVKLPDVNETHKGFRIDGEFIHAPISILTGIGEKAYEQLVGKAPYDDLRDFTIKHFALDREGRGVNQGIVRNMIVAGVMDSLFVDGRSPQEKMELFLAIKAEIREEKVEQLDEDFLHPTPLGLYMAKKHMVSMYSEDLRKIFLERPIRDDADTTVLYKFGNDFKLNKNAISKVSEDVTVFGGRVLEGLQQKLENEEFINEGMRFCAIGYVVEEKAIKFGPEKTKRGTKMTIDVEGHFYEDVLWPAWGDDEADYGFKKLPVLLFYKTKIDKLQLSRVVPLIDKADLKKYNL